MWQTHRTIADREKRSLKRARNDPEPDNRRELRVDATVYICMHVLSSHIAEYKSTGKLPILFMVSRTGKNLLVPVKIWFRGTVLAAPSRVRMLTYYTNAESGAYPRDSSRCPRPRPYVFTTIHHRVSHELIGSRNFVPMVFTAESPLCPNITTFVLLLYILWTRPPPPRLMYVQA